MSRCSTPIRITRRKVYVVNFTHDKISAMVQKYYCAPGGGVNCLANPVTVVPHAITVHWTPTCFSDSEGWFVPCFSVTCRAVSPAMVQCERIVLWHGCIAWNNSSLAMSHQWSSAVLVLVARALIMRHRGLCLTSTILPCASAAAHGWST
mgnify:CR=1 FL=1